MLVSPYRLWLRAQWLLRYGIIGIVALLLRVLHLSHFVHTDEVNFWIPRSNTFLDAIQAGDYAATAISTHPGATTMWLGSVGILLRRALFAHGLIAEETFPLILATMRLPVVITHVAALLLGYMLLRRIIAPWIAFLAAFLWATDPFVAAFQQFLHVDALMGTFATLSVLAASVYWNTPSSPSFPTRSAARWHWLVLSGCCAALAIISKSPGLAVVPIIGMLALLTTIDTIRHHQQQGIALPQAIQNGTTSCVVRMMMWGGSIIATMIIVWPAIWADPMRVYNLMRVGVEVEGASRHVILNFFLGKQEPIPGPLYYPVVLAIRTTPLSLVGLLLLPIAMRDRVLFPTPAQRSAAVLAGFMVLFVVAMSLFAKKLDRYMEPTFMAIDVLAAMGLGWAMVRLATVLHRRFAHYQWMTPARGVAALTSSIAIGALAHSVWWHPYGIACYNELFGGVRRGVQTVLIGEGEGLGEVARWLNAQPNITGVTTTSTMVHTLQAFMRHGAQIVSEKGAALDTATGYVVIYIRHMQRWQGNPPPPYNRFYDVMPPVYTVNIHGVDYVRVYQVPPTVEQHVGATFGDAIQLYGYSLDATTIRETGCLSLTLEWFMQQPPATATDYMLFAHLFNEQGQRISQVDVPPAGDAFPSHTWQPHRYVHWVHPIPVPKDIPAGTYWLALGVYDPASFARLPLHISNTPLFFLPHEQLTMPHDGDHALFLMPFRVMHANTPHTTTESIP